MHNFLPLVARLILSILKSKLVVHVVYSDISDTNNYLPSKTCSYHSDFERQRLYILSLKVVDLCSRSTTYFGSSSALVIINEALSV